MGSYTSKWRQATIKVHTLGYRALETEITQIATVHPFTTDFSLSQAFYKNYIAAQNQA